MIRQFLFAFVAAAVFVCAGCGIKEVSASDQKAMEAKYSQSAYEDAMKKAGRGQELEEQKRLDEERKRASGDH
jgi:hypothetical protein